MEIGKELFVVSSRNIIWGDVADDRMQLEIDETNLISGMTEEEF